MSRPITALIIAGALAACSANPAPSTSAAACAGNRILTVTNKGDEAVIVFAQNGRNTTEIGAVPIGVKELVVPPALRATSYFAVASSRQALNGSAATATTDTRVTFVEECRAK